METYARDGLIDMIVSQHTPHRTVDKYASDPIPGEYAPKAGFSAIDTAFPILLDRLGLAVACRLYCENPARHFGVSKGKIAPGYDADLAIVEEGTARPERNIHVHGSTLDNAWRVDPATFISKGKITPFVADRLKYRICSTFLRGEEVFNRAKGLFTKVETRLTHPRNLAVL